MHDADDSHVHVHGVAVYQRKLTSVGIDIGSATTHLTFSSLIVGQTDSSFQRKPEILQRSVIYRSPILFTPFEENGTIDQAAIAEFTQACHREAGIRAEDIHAGAVICTGEAARRHNARLITETLAKIRGVSYAPRPATISRGCSPHMDREPSRRAASSAALSSISISAAAQPSRPSAAMEGSNRRRRSTSARVCSWSIRTMWSFAPSPRPFASPAVWESTSRWAPASTAPRARIAAAMSDLLMQFLGLGEMTPLARELMLTEPPLEFLPSFSLICSGGVSEYMFDVPSRDPGDLGPLLAAALGERLRGNERRIALLPAKERIRATVIGACQFTLQVSGETVFASDAARLPLHNVPVLSVPIDWERPLAGDVASAVGQALDALDGDEACALFLGGPRLFGYSTIADLARGIAAGLESRRKGSQTVLIFSSDLANTVGLAMRPLLAGVPYICLDEISVADLDYLDIDVAPEGENYYPVVVKSLIFEHHLTGSGGSSRLAPNKSPRPY